MARFGSKENPAIVRVENMERGAEIISLCTKHNWVVVVGIEPDKPEDISDVERLWNAIKPVTRAVTIGRNEPCPCGSGEKYKNCCLR